MPVILGQNGRYGGFRNAKKLCDFVKALCKTAFDSRYLDGQFIEKILRFDDPITHDRRDFFRLCLVDAVKDTLLTGREPLE